MGALERFMSKVAKDANGCWVWTASRNPAGYGQFQRGKRGEGCILAHRWSYEHHVGPIPDGLVLDHLCRVRHCVNPEHLEPVTIRENAIVRGQGVWASRSRQTQCLNGHTLKDAYVKQNGTRQCRHCPALYREKQRALPVR